MKNLRTSVNEFLVDIDNYIDRNSSSFDAALFRVFYAKLEESLNPMFDDATMTAKVKEFVALWDLAWNNRRGSGNNHPKFWDGPVLNLKLTLKAVAI